MPKLTRGSPSFFYPTPTKFGFDIGEWPMLNANVLEFRFVLIVRDLARKNGANFGVFVPVCFRRHSEEIGIANVLLGTKPRRVGKFCGCRFSDV